MVYDAGDYAITSHKERTADHTVVRAVGMNKPGQAQWRGQVLYGAVNLARLNELKEHFVLK